MLLLLLPPSILLFDACVVVCEKKFSGETREWEWWWRERRNISKRFIHKFVRNRTHAATSWHDRESSWNKWISKQFQLATRLWWSFISYPAAFIIHSQTPCDVVAFTLPTPHFTFSMCLRTTSNQRAREHFSETKTYKHKRNTFEQSVFSLWFVFILRQTVSIDLSFCTKWKLNHK